MSIALASLPTPESTERGSEITRDLTPPAAYVLQKTFRSLSNPNIHSCLRLETLKTYQL